MKKAIIGKKLGMTQIFLDNGQVVPVTVVEAGPCVVVQKKTVENDGYSAIQIGFGEIAERKVNKPETGHFKKSNLAPRRVLKELRLENAQDYEVGQSLTCDLFAVNEFIDVSGISKGHGFTGSIKRWNHHRGKMTHGSKFHRAPGTLAARAAARVPKGRKMPGHYGVDNTTILNLRVVRVIADRNLLLVRGSVPGQVGCLLTIKNAAKK